MKACAEAASEARDKELEKQAGKLDKQIASLQDKLFREERELQQDQSELQNRKIEAGANLLGFPYPGPQKAPPHCRQTSPASRRRPTPARLMGSRPMRPPA